MATVLATVGLFSVRATAAEGYVKYYVVTASFDGRPENLTGIAARFLGDGARSIEIFNLNSGRQQADGQVLTDPVKLRAGWRLAMPWDATGTGIEYGILTATSDPGGSKPTTTKPTSTKPSPSPGRTSTPKSTPGTAAPPGPTVAQSVPAGGSRPSTAATPSARPSGGGPSAAGCAAAAASTTHTDWARLQIAADQAWPVSRGKGQLVAVVDSGVSAIAPPLAKHVAVGLNVVDGTSRGDTDCLGTGTTMAGIIAAQPGSDGGPAGVAPDATILPVRLVTSHPQAAPDVQVRAIEAAVTAGATVVALGGYVNGGDARVAKAIAAAVARDVVVVASAPLASAPADSAATLGDGVLLVAGIGADDRFAAEHRSGTVDVVAPGVNVAGLNPAGTGMVNGTGTHYAVAFVAAEAALVRSAFPDLTASQVTHRVMATADRKSEGSLPHSQFGYGFVNPAAAVTKALEEETTEAPAMAGSEAAAAPGPAVSEQDGYSGTQTTVLVVTVLLMIAAGILLSTRIRRLLRGGDPADPVGAELIDPRLEVPSPVLADASSGGQPWDDDGRHWTDPGR